MKKKLIVLLVTLVTSLGFGQAVNKPVPTKQTVTAHSVALSWSEVGTVSNFNIYRSTVSGTSYTNIGSTGSGTITTYTDSTVAFSTTYYYVATAVDSTGHESAFSNQAQAIIPMASPVITSLTTATGIVGTAFSYQITASGSPTSFGATGLPAGLTVNTSTGLISGTPTANGPSTITLSATNSGGTGTASLTLTVTNPAPPAAPTRLTVTVN